MSSITSSDISPKLTRGGSVKLIIAASMGNALELFDFTVFSFFAAIIGSQFFPSSSPYGSLLMAVSVFGVGFIMRPLGGMLLGAYADRKGRKKAMLLTIVLMGLGTATIALTPNYQQIGIAAPIAILIGRLIQGFSAGGEIGACTSLLLESASDKKKGFFLSWQVASQGVSSLLGGLCGTILSASLSTEALHQWGWRIPFLVGLIIIPIGLFIRRQLDETLQKTSASQQNKNKPNPIAEYFTHHWPSFLLGLTIIMAATLLTYIIIFYMPTYMMRVSDISPTLSYIMSLLVSVILIISGLLAGRVLDKMKQYKRITLASIVVSIVLIYPSFALITNPSTLWFALFLRLLLIVALGFNMTAGILMITEALPRQVRATGLSITYASGVAIFGGSAQFMVTWLLQASGNSLAPAWYLIFMLIISLIGCAFFKERHLEHEGID